MHKNKNCSVFIVITLILSICASSFAVAFSADTVADKRKEAKEAAQKAAKATKNLEDAEDKLKVLQKEIENTKAEIETIRKKIKKKKKQINQQEDDLGNRLTGMYKTGTVGYVDVILSSQDISDLMSNIGMVQKILESDQELLRKLGDDHKKLKKMKKNLEAQEQNLEASEIQTEELKKKFQKEADEWKAKEEQLEAEADALAAQLAAQMAAAGGSIDDKLKKLGANINTSNYAWPTAGSNITSDYGYRICPFHGKEFHNGIDIGIAKGTPVYAIQDGVINRASWYGGYGNCIILQCGGGVSALYGHLSGYDCSAGQFVTRGQIIGYVGSTGNSTGPHLHFTVFKYDEATGANPYISPWSLY